jgi:hypothetical protein
MNVNQLLVSVFVLAAATGCGQSDVATKPVASKPVITASSKTGEFGPQGLFDAAQPGWHSAQPPKYPESLTLDFGSPRQVKLIGLLGQDGQPARAAKALRIESSSDGKAWTAVGGSENACASNKPDGWFDVDLANSITTQYLRIVIFSNCGDATLLTLRGLRVVE